MKKGSKLPGKASTLPPPACVPEDARELWVTTLLSMAAERALDHDALPLVERYVTAFSRWRAAEAKLAATGPVTEAPISGVPAVNPWLGIARREAAIMASLERSLCLGPLHRGRVTQTRNPIAADGTPLPKSTIPRMADFGIPKGA